MKTITYEGVQHGDWVRCVLCGSILVAFGEENAETLRSSNIEGRYIQVNQEPCNAHVDWEQRRYEMAKPCFRSHPYQDVDLTVN